ncbi:type II secretion system protein [Chitinimonas taiwanensis]|uniref:type II secretion system protein n=1 Tax=Chitinimonas taiwanensis TaxID=240412 RepID=UPI0035AF4638
MRAAARGFTLIELMVTLAILAVLASVVVPSAQLGVQRMRETELKRALREIRDGIDAYKAAYTAGHIERRPDGNGYPPDLATLVNGVNDQLDPEGRRRYFLRRIPSDPFCQQAEPERCWGLRSYASPADAPRSGEDVYDVYSLATGVGLNGIAYRNW